MHRTLYRPQCGHRWSRAVLLLLLCAISSWSACDAACLSSPAALTGRTTKLGRVPWLTNHLVNEAAKIVLEERLGVTVQFIDQASDGFSLTNASIDHISDGDLDASLFTYLPRLAPQVFWSVEPVDGARRMLPLDVWAQNGLYIPSYLQTNYPSGDLDFYRSYQDPSVATLFPNDSWTGAFNLTESTLYGGACVHDGPDNYTQCIPILTQSSAHMGDWTMQVIDTLGLNMSLVSVGSRLASIVTTLHNSGTQPAYIFMTVYPSMLLNSGNYTRISLPSLNANCFLRYANGSVGCDYPAFAITKLLSPAVAAANIDASDIVYFLRRFNLDNNDIDDLLDPTAATIGGLSDDDGKHAAACKWVQEHEAVWSEWIKPTTVTIDESHTLPLYMVILLPILVVSLVAAGLVAFYFRRDKVTAQQALEDLKQIVEESDADDALGLFRSPSFASEAAVGRRRSKKKDVLQSPLEKMIKAVQSLQRLAELRAAHEESAAGRCGRNFVTFCTCGLVKSRYRIALEEKIKSEERALLEHITALLRNSRNYMAPNIQEHLKNGTMQIEDNATREWVMKELGNVTDNSVMAVSVAQLAASPSLDSNSSYERRSWRRLMNRRSGDTASELLPTPPQAETRRSRRHSAASGRYSGSAGVLAPIRVLTAQSTIPRVRPADSPRTSQTSTEDSAHTLATTRNNTCDLLSVNTEGDGGELPNTPFVDMKPVPPASPSTAQVLELEAAAGAHNKDFLMARKFSIFNAAPEHIVARDNVSLSVTEEIRSKRATASKMPLPFMSVDDNGKVQFSKTLQSGKLLPKLERINSSSSCRESTHSADEGGEDADTVEDMGDSEELSDLEASLDMPLCLLEEHTLILREAVQYWHFDIFEAATISGHNPLPMVGYALFRRHNLLAQLSLDPAKVQRALIAISRGYHVENPFHNAIHAADVAQSTSYFFCQTKLGDIPPPEIFAAILAALCHDFDHPGVNNSFLIATSHPLAMRYNDSSVLENHHVSAALSLLKSSAETDLLGSLPSDKMRSVRTLVINLVMATDLANNFNIIGEFKRRFQPAQPVAPPKLVHRTSERGLNKRMSNTSHQSTTDLPAKMEPVEIKPTEKRASLRFGKRPEMVQIDVDAQARNAPTAPESPKEAAVQYDFPTIDESIAKLAPADLLEANDRLLLLKMALKCADLGHPAKNWDAHFKWTQLVSEEFYRQGEREAQLGLPISPFMDRSKHDQLAKQQMGFFDFLVLPMWKGFLNLFNPRELLQCHICLSENRKEWERRNDPQYQNMTQAQVNALQEAMKQKAEGMKKDEYHAACSSASGT